ncbi:MAG: hypothetical protein ABIU87_03135 [Ornithinibacter sp.]
MTGSARTLAVLVVVIAGGWGASARADDLVVGGTTVTATSKDGKTTADVTLINVGSTDAGLRPVVVGGDPCVVSPDPDHVAPRQSMTVTLTLEPGCPSDATVQVDLDGAAGSVPVLNIKPPEDESIAFSVVITGGLVGLVLAVVTMGMVAFRRRQFVASMNEPEVKGQRLAAHTALLDRIEAAKVATNFVPDPKKLPKPPADVAVVWSTPLVHLDASWKFSDSWLANANLGIAGLVTFLSTTNVLDAVMTKTPASVTSTIAITAALAVLLVAIANAALRVFGDQTKVPTVGGFTVAIALSVLATALNAVTIAQMLNNVESDIGMGMAKPFVLFGAVAVLLGVLMRYVWVSVLEVLRDGVAPPGSPSDPDVVRAAWVIYAALNPGSTTTVPTAWDNSDLVAAYGSSGGGPTAPRGYPSPQFGTSLGDGPAYRRRTSAMP